MGKCYDGGWIITKLLNHPMGDQFYVVATTLALGVGLLAMIIYLMIMEWEELQGTVNPRYVVPIRGTSIKALTLLGLCSACFQFPIHVLMTTALRATNQHLLTDSDESRWGFGQSVAVILLLGTVKDCICAWSGEFFRSPGC